MRGSVIAISPGGLVRAALVALALMAGAVPATAQRPGHGEDESAALVAEGRRLLARRDLNDAARALDQAIALNPRRIEAYVLRAAIHLAHGQYQSGIAITRRARGLAPNNNDVLGMLGMLLVRGGSPDEGVPLLEKVVARFPRRYDAQGALGRHYAARRKWAQAITAFEAYLKARPDELAGSDRPYRIGLANAYLRDGRPAQAQSLFAAIVKDRRGDVRARLGRAWATAAIDCRKARPMLSGLAQLTERYPEVWLVDGQCALAMGDARAATRLAQRYVARREASGAGHALVGEARAALGELSAARAAFGRARKLEPRHRRWAVRLAHVLRLEGDSRGAIAELEAIRPPLEPVADPDWWLELGEALIADGRAKTAAARLGPVVAAVPRDASLRTVLGDALYRSGEAAGAVKWLEEAESLKSSRRSRDLLARSLEVVAAGQLASGDLESAEGSLARAAAVQSSSRGAAIGRNLGVVRLALRRPAEAAPPLEKSALQESNALTWMLLGRARAAAGDAGAARNAYSRAASVARGAAAIEVAIDAAAFELEAGEPAAAVTGLERVQAQWDADSALAARYRRALAVARHAAGLAALRGGESDRAVKLLEAAAAGAAGSASRAIQCDLALATVASGKRTLALRRLGQLGAGPCPFPAPADTQAVPILLALSEGLSARKARRALERLYAFERRSTRSTGPARQLLKAAVRVAAMTAADHAYRAGRRGEARRHLALAERVGGSVAADELAHNMAVLDIADGRLAGARAVLEKLAPRLDRALINLGVAYDREGNTEGALEAWTRARQRGVRFGPLTEWIAAKELVHGGGDAAP
jgi:predicted Zn-dependent protease